MSPEVIDRVELVDVDKLIPYHNNPKTHPEEQVDKIASSIKNYGFTVPVVIDDEYEIIMGHGRLQAARKLGLREIPAIVRDDLTEAEMRALRIADNRLTEGDWDIEALAEELDLLEMDGVDLSFTGFDDEEIEQIQFPADIDADFEVEESANKDFREYTFLLTDGQYDVVRERIEEAIERGLGDHKDNPHRHSNALYHLLNEG